MTVIPMRASCPSAECSALLNSSCGRGGRTPWVPGRPKNDIRFQRAYVSQLSPNSHTVQGGVVYLFQFCYGSSCGASFCCLALMFAALQTRRFATQQTCDQRSGIASGSKLERRALTFYFPVISYYMFPLLKCKGGWDIGLCVTSGLAKRMPLRVGEF